MFYGCTSLTTAPELPATTLDNGCYYYMFHGTNVLPDCSNIDFTSESVVDSRGLRGLFAGTKVTDEDLYNILPVNPLTGKYCLPVTTLAENCYQHMFYNCTSLVTAPELLATTLASYCYVYMFSKCTSLVTAPELPATTLVQYCYRYMFENCTSLVNAPELPATTLAKNCYEYMFSGCTSLVNAPELPATTLVQYCYSNMFYGCTSLVTAPELLATTLAITCYSNMFYGCTSLVTAPELPATSLVPYCYQNMFARCTSLTTAPELPATTLDNGCYNYMFQNCTKLNYIKALFTTTPSSTYTSYWVSGVSSTGTFVKNVNAMWDVTGTSGIPSGWTVKTNFTPVRCINLSITAEDVSGKYTTTKIYWTAEIEGVDDEGNNLTIILTGTDTSESFPQNTSTTDTIERTISYTYMGVTATTTITQGIWVNSTYTIDLNNQWQSSSVVNPDSSLYDGVYESFSNKGVNSTAATMYIDINGYDVFDLYIRSYAESSYDYVMVSQLDQTINNNTAYSSTTLVKAHTRGKQKSGTSIDNYTKVSFTGIDGGQHRITIVYRKDGSGNSGDDRGYVLIPKNQ